MPSGNTAVDVIQVCSIMQVPLARFVMMSTENDTTTFQFHSPQTGSYLLDIFAAVYPTFEQGGGPFDAVLKWITY